MKNYKTLLRQVRKLSNDLIIYAAVPYILMYKRNEVVTGNDSDIHFESISVPTETRSTLEKNIRKSLLEELDKQKKRIDNSKRQKPNDIGKTKEYSPNKKSYNFKKTALTSNALKYR